MTYLITYCLVSSNCQLDDFHLQIGLIHPRISPCRLNLHQLDAQNYHPVDPVLFVIKVGVLCGVMEWSWYVQFEI